MSGCDGLIRGDSDENGRRAIQMRCGAAIGIVGWVRKEDLLKHQRITAAMAAFGFGNRYVVRDAEHREYFEALLMAARLLCRQFVVALAGNGVRAVLVV